MILNMFRASLCSSSGGQLYIYSIWYRYTLYGSIQSVTIPDTVNVHCPPEDEHSDARNMLRIMM
jgi:hypothetical protein